MLGRFLLFVTPQESDINEPGGVPAPQIPPASSEYALIVRDVATLEILGELPVFESLVWTRRKVESGDFQIDINTAALSPDADGNPNVDLIQPQRLIEIRRDGVFEFAGVIQGRKLDAISGDWTLTGPDLLGYFLSRRKVGIDATDDVSDMPAETAMKHYLDANGGPGSDLARRFETELFHLGFEIEPDQGRGSHVDFTALRKNLLAEVLTPIAKAGDLLHEIVMVNNGYRYQVSAPVSASGLPFSLSSLNVGEMSYEDSLDDVHNAVTVLGDGSGDTRNTSLVEDGESIVQYGRRESFLDARDTATDDERTQAGSIEVIESEQKRVRGDAKPLILGSKYREDYDVGQDVTLALVEYGIAAVTRRVVGVTITLDKDGEKIAVLLGDSPRSIGSVVSDALKRGLRAQFA